jgi:hypothetical protein
MFGLFALFLHANPLTRELAHLRRSTDESEPAGREVLLNRFDPQLFHCANRALRPSSLISLSVISISSYF